MAMTAAEKQAAYRARQRGNGNAIQTVTRVTKESVTVTLPVLPADEVIACNADIGWPDILRMTRDDIDYVYRAWCAVHDDILLRLKRAAGYHRRMVA